MNNHYNKIPYFLFSLCMYIILPFSYYIFNNKSEVLILMLLIIFPIKCFIISYLYSYNNYDFSYLLSIIIGMLFYLSCIILLNFDLYIYIIFYVFASLCGQGTGYCLKFIKNTIKNR